jgi:hippurate hydrolase
MDALRVDEENEVEYCSTHPGQMHACAHDGHMAMGLGVLDYFATHDFAGKVKIIFQPAEENLGGAEPMIAVGAMDDVDYIFGYHIWPDVNEFKVAISEGAQMSAGDAFSVKVIGKGGHSAMPERAINPLDVMNEIINRFRPIQAMDCILVVTKLHTGNATNVIPSEGDMGFLLRTKDMVIREEIISLINRVINEVADEYKAKAIIDHERAYPVTMNDKAVVKKLKTFLDTEEIEYPSLASEDFSYFLMKKPGAFIWLGCKTDGIESLHHPKFHFNERILEYGVGEAVKIIHEFLK